ncbi:MAG: dihydroxy-acid dehydratase, partial [Kineosporiaceae bacterium]
PEAAAGGPLGKVRTGDWIRLEVEARRLDVEVPDADLDARPVSNAMLSAVARPRRGWEKLYVDTVLGAETGADLDFLVGGSGHAVARESH